MKLLRSLASLFLLCLSAASQPPPNRTSTTGPNSPANTGNYNVFIYENMPNEGALPISVHCDLPPGQDICQLECLVKSAKRPSLASRDVTIGFIGVIPAHTRFSAPPEFRLKMEKSESLQVPLGDGSVDKGLRAFSIQIPLLPKGTNFMFSLWTEDDDNRAACRQLQVISQKQGDVLRAFFDQLRTAKAAKKEDFPDIDVALSAVAKTRLLFRPGSVVAESGRRQVEFVTPREVDARRKLEHLLQTFGPQFPEIFRAQGECVAPVMTVEQDGGKTTTFAQIPPIIATFLEPTSIWIDFAALAPNNADGSVTIPIGPTIPKKYECRALP